MADYPTWGREALAAADFDSDDAARRRWDEVLQYQSLAGGDGDLARKIAEVESTTGLPGNRIIYFSLPPEVFESSRRVGRVWFDPVPRVDAAGHREAVR